MANEIVVYKPKPDEPLKPGDKVVTLNIAGTYSQFNNQICEVVSGEGEWMSTTAEGGTKVLLCYSVMLPNGSVIGVARKCLMKIPLVLFRGDMDKKISWEQCCWKPKHLREE